MVTMQLCATLGAAENASVESVCGNHLERVLKLFDALDLDQDGMQGVKAAVAEARASGKWERACAALLKYYENTSTVAWLRRPVVLPGGGRVPEADAILNNEFTLYTISAKVPRRSDGGLDWTYNGPDGDREWGWGLNRHHWAKTLFDAYLSTGNRIYVTGLDQLLRDWVVSNPYPAEHNTTPQWRGLEVFMRVAKSWGDIFYGLQGVPEFSPATRILMLSTIPDHAHYARNFHRDHGNWIAMELLGLAAAAVQWPEFKESNAWFDYAINRMLPEMTNQVYPDGVQKELTSDYHRVTLGSFEEFVILAGHAGKPIPQDFRDGVERMANYVAYSITPSGFAPLNNDADMDLVRAEVLAHAKSINRPDWKYIATNGAEGTRPEGQPSVIFPWAGQLIMRSGWDAEAHWAFFDIGPLGIGHWHCDKLHLSVSAYGRDILVDSGRYTYVGGPWREYFTGSPSHNVILVDGHPQQKYKSEATEPLKDCYSILPEYDYARGTYDAGYAALEGEATHTRAVMYVRGRYWVVVDRITTDRPRTVQALWHFHPDCTVVVDGGCVASTDEAKGNVRITPVSDLAWQVELIKGQTEPSIQGWWSRTYNEKQPNTCAVYSAPIQGSTTFAWVIVPGKGPVPALSQTGLLQVTDTGVQLDIQCSTEPCQTVGIPISGTVECRIGAKGNS